MGSSNQRRWDLISKSEPIEAYDGLDMDTVDADDLGFLEIPTQLDLDHLDLDLAAPGGSLAASGGAAGRGGSYPMFVGGGGSIDRKLHIKHDCMWSGMCENQSHPENSGGVGGGRCSHRQQHFRPLHLLQQQQQQQQQQTNNVVGVQQEAAEQPQTQAGEDVAVPEVATMAMEGAIGRPLGMQRISLIGRSLKPSVGPLTPFQPVQSYAQIPSGGSLLIGRYLQHQQQQQPQPSPQQQPQRAVPALLDSERRVNQLRQQLLLLDENPDEILLGGPINCPHHYHTDDPRPDSPDNPLSQLLRDLRSLSSPFTTVSSSSSTLAAVPSRGNALTVNGDSSGMMQFRSSLQHGSIDLLDHRQEPAACRYEPRGGGPCALDGDGGSRSSTLLGSRKRPNSWIGGVYQNTSCPSEANDDDEDEEDEDEDACSVANSGCDWMQSVGGRGSRCSTVVASSAARSRSHQRQQQCRRVALAVTASRPYDASKKSSKRSEKQQHSLEQAVVEPAVITLLNTGPVDAIGNTTTMAGSYPSGSSSYDCLQAMHVDDHSVTRPKGRYSMNELGVQTPSDSEEEIDVVSIDDKSLPTNPTARNRRRLQSELASKICSAFSRSPNGALHSSHQRHNAGASHYQHHHGLQTPQHPKEAIVGVVASSAVSVRGHQQQHGGHSKRSAGEGGRSCSVTSAAALDNRRWTTSVNPADELDTAEKRILLCKNSEWQRRIEMKNLFEQLKRQIPRLRNKHRVSKANILCEAIVLCTRFNRKADQIQELRQRRQKLYERIRDLRSAIQRQQHTNVHPIANID